MLLTKYIQEFVDSDTVDDDIDDTVEADTADDMTLVSASEYFTNELDGFLFEKDANMLNVTVAYHLIKYQTKYIVNIWEMVNINNGLCIMYPIKNIANPSFNYRLKFQFNEGLILYVNFLTVNKNQPVISCLEDKSESLKQLNKKWNRLGVPPNILLAMVRHSCIGLKFIVE